MDEKIVFKDNELEFEPTEAELQRYQQVQKQYLLALEENNIEIPADKLKMYRILIDKDYSEHPFKEEIKKKQPSNFKMAFQQKMKTMNKTDAND